MEPELASRDACSCRDQIPHSACSRPSPLRPRSNFTDTKALQAAALVVVVVGCLAYLGLIAKSFFVATHAEPRKVAEVRWGGRC